MKEEITPLYIEKLMNPNKKGLLKPKDPISYIKNNYNELIDNVPRKFFASVIETLYQNEKLKDFMDEKFVFNMNRARGNNVEIVCKIYLISKSEKEREKFLTEKIPQIIEQINEDNIHDYLKLKSQDRVIREKLNQKIIKNKRKYIEDYILGRVNQDYVYLDDVMIDLLEKIIEEILEHENLDWIDINYRISGGYSSIFEIGSKILKIGEKRETYRIPYDKRILQPLIRINLSDLSSDNIGTIEVCEKVLTKEDISDEELYQIYRELRERGKIWADIKAENVGILLKENKRHWDKNLADSKRALGYMEDEFFNEEDEVLPAGEYIIIDSDYIYNESNKCIPWLSGLALDFEIRYYQEKNIIKK